MALSDSEEDTTQLNVGDSFSSFEELEKKIAEYQDSTNTVFYKRDTTTIAACRKQGIKKTIEPKLKYYYLKYCCIHGGKKFKTHSNGVRSSSTFQKACAAFFQVGVNTDGRKLIIKSVDFTHNHETTKNLYQHLPQVRRLKQPFREEAKKLLELDANKVKLKERLREETGKMVLLKDLHNIGAKKKEKNNLITVVDTLKDKYRADCTVLESNKVFQGLFFVTPAMKSAMKHYPEYLGIDATFKLLDIRAAVYLMIVEDSNGCSEIVATCILMSEDKASMTWMMDCFKESHPTWPKIQCVMTDKDLTERDVIRSSFPSANLIICAFHTLRTFNREINTEKLGITSTQRDIAKDILQKMVYAATDDRYNHLYRELQYLPQSVIDYFDKNWHPIRHEWSLSTNYMQHNFLNTTNNRVESLNAKIKGVVHRYSSLEDFIEQFLTYVACFHTERDHRAATAYQKTRILHTDQYSPEAHYAQLLTDYAFKFVKSELEQMSPLELPENNQMDTLEIQISALDKLFVTVSSCTCKGRVGMQLPCRHIFAVRDLKNINLYDESLCHPRWCAKYYFETQRVFASTSNLPDVAECIVSSSTYRKKVQAQHEKFKNASIISKHLASLASEMAGSLYIQRLKNLTDLKNAWENNEEVMVVTVRNYQDLEQQDLEQQGETESEKSRVSVSCSEDENLEPVQSIAVTQSPEHSLENIAQCNDLSAITIPPAMRVRGRPKGSNATVIGLPKKSKNIIAPFVKKNAKEKISIMLHWLVDDEIVIKRALAGNFLIQENHLETKPEKISCAILDENVDLSVIKKFLHEDAWSLLNQIYKTKKDLKIWECALCEIDLETTIDDKDKKITIVCDYCLEWYHLICAKISTKPKMRYWMCAKCR